MRRRSLFLLAAVLASTAGYCAQVLFGTPSPRPIRAVLLPVRITQHSARPLLISSVEEPGALTVSRSGTLYVIDRQRDAVLEFVGGGRFTTVAGDGQTGYAGDGNLAIAAELDDPSGLAVGADGTLYIADSGNNRLRAMLPDGRIETVAGTGSPSWSRGSAAARSAAVGGIAALAAGPDGALYLAGAGGLSVLRDGTVSWLAGEPATMSDLPCGTVHQSTFTDLDAVALDTRGDLFVSNNNCHEIAERAASGILLDVEGAGLHGSVMPVASDPLGGIVTGGIGVHLLGATHNPYVGLATGKVPGLGGYFVADHIAFGVNGTLFADNNDGDSWGSSAIVQLAHDGAVASVLWRTSKVWR